MARRANGKSIRLATKSLRCRYLQDLALSLEGFSGLLAFTLPEALWLADHGATDVLVAYPSADRSALARLGDRLRAETPARIVVMVDDAAHLDLIDEAAGARPHPVHVCIDVDAGWRLLGGRVRLGAKRSPLHDPDQVVALAHEVTRRVGFELAGLMAYEAQIAGVGNRPPGKRLRGAAISAMQRRSARELAGRREQIVAAVERIAPLSFVNAGGTGSIESTAAEPVVTEIGAGSGLYAPLLFDAYSSFTPRPAALFALPVVRRPGPDVATLLGGGYIASGPGGADRLPQPCLPPGLELDPQEGAGEVQTPVRGPAADHLQIGDRVYFRHAKAGELCERFATLLLIDGNEVVDEVPTYRGEGATFL